jgi:tRNA A-37 threonylcarbamoyl transferase component Bud32
LLLALSLETISKTIKEVFVEEIKKLTSTHMYDISSPQMSDSEVAFLHMTELGKKMPTFAMPQTEGPEICLEYDWSRLIAKRKAASVDANTTSEGKTAIAHESYLCWQMTPYLQAIFEQGDIVVNSEDYKWVQTYGGSKQNYMKPDFFVTLKGLMVRQESSGMSYIKTLRNETEIVGYYFGKMLWEIRDCMRVLIEFKNKLAPEHFGKLVIYLQHLSRDSKGCMYYGMLCDDTNIILASCCDSMICSRYDLKWTTPGSLAFVRKFVCPENQWMQLLNLSMSRLGVQLKSDAAFLGMGRNGRAFRIEDSDGRALALKIVLTPDDGLVHTVFAEYNTLRRLRDKHLPVVTVMGNDASSVYAENDDHCLGVCYVMEELGTPVTVQNADHLRSVFMLLFALHSQNEFHGDPRLTNIICFEGKLLWIDFSTLHVLKTEEFLKKCFANDIRILTRSVSKYCTMRNDEYLVFDECVSTYANDPSELHLNTILSTFFELIP